MKVSIEGCCLHVTVTEDGVKFVFSKLVDSKSLIQGRRNGEGRRYLVLNDIS